MNITLLKYFFLPADTSDPNPIFGRVDEEDQATEKYLCKIFDSAQNFQGFQLMTFTDLQDYRIFKGKEEANDYFLEHWP